MAPNGASTEVGEDEIGAVTISEQFENGELRVTVSDTGPGIPDYAREALFEPFKGSQKPGGSGLGVAISAEIIRAHGGELFLAHSDSEGTRFLIVLPHAEGGA